jgi:vancomycin resistance protein YoaR
LQARIDAGDETDMATEEIDLVDEIFGLKSGDAAGGPAAPRSPGWDSIPEGKPTPKPTSPPASSFELEPAPGEWKATAPAAATRTRRRSAGKFAIAFAIGAAATLILLCAVAVAAFSVSAGRVVPGVRVGSVDVSGMSRDQVIARLQSTYGYLDQGDVSINTPLGAAQITYQTAGRTPDVEAMADAAMAIGHSGNSVDDAVAMLRSRMTGETVPVVIRLDPTAVAASLRELVGTSNVLPKNAGVAGNDGAFSVTKSTPGIGIDEKAISTAVISALSAPDAPSHIRIDEAFIELAPNVSDQDAQNAIEASQTMTTEVDLTWSTAGSTTPPTTFKVDPQTIRSWIVFGIRPDGSFGPWADPALVQAYLNGLSGQVAIPAVEPHVVYDKSGKASGLTGGQDGVAIDQVATSNEIEARLEAIASSGTQTASLPIVSKPLNPQITLDSLNGMSIIGNGKGAWTTIFFPDISNGNGANIRVPAALLNGQVVAPGQQFSFLNAVGPIDAAHGYTMGGVIKGGKSDHTGAMGGGICSASTTMFNAAARAGMQIDERHAHFYYISRYPVGLDATVYSNGYQVWDLKWTNDTPNPILIRAYSTKGSKSKITIELWSLPLDRTVTFSPEHKDNVVKATDHTVYVTTLAPGVQNRAEYPTDGYDTSRTRIVTDSTGRVIHNDTWKSHYTKVDGLLEIGIAAKPAPTPTPTPTSGAGAAAATEAASSGTVNAQRRRVA